MYKDIKIAFFDCDETVISFKSMFSFLKYFLYSKYNQEGENRFNKYMDNVKLQWTQNVPREIININYYKQFENEYIDDVLSACNKWIIDEKLKLGENFYIKETIDAIKKYKGMGCKIVIVSGSLYNLIYPIAVDIGADEILATRMSIVNNLFTGDIIPPQTIGKGKAEAVKNYLNKNHIARKNSIAWGDHDSDFDMLHATGKGVIISDNILLIKKAKEHGFFPVLRQ